MSTYVGRNFNQKSTSCAGIGGGWRSCIPGTGYLQFVYRTME